MFFQEVLEIDSAIADGIPNEDVPFFGFVVHQQQRLHNGLMEGGVPTLRVVARGFGGMAGRRWVQ
jgi:hypothetical protein